MDPWEIGLLIAITAFGFLAYLLIDLAEGDE